MYINTIICTLYTVDVAYKNSIIYLFIYGYIIQGVFIFLLHVIRNKQVNMCVYWSSHGNCYISLMLKVVKEIRGCYNFGEMFSRLHSVSE